MAKDNIKTLNQWGYKIYIRPILGASSGRQSMEDGSRCAFDNLTIQIGDIISSLIQSKKSSQLGKEMRDLLEWHLLSTGFESQYTRNYLVENSEREQLNSSIYSKLQNK